MESIGFNKPYLTGKELTYISDAHSRGQLAGDGYYTHRCSRWLEQNTGSLRVLLTHSCTAALEMAAILTGVGEGDEVIMPSYTFVTTATSFVMRGATPVFIDIRPDTLNIDENLIEAAITERTRAIVVVHYAGVACEMDRVISIAEKYGLKVIEDAAQGILGHYKGRALGTIGHLGCYSFHETKNVTCGEGGAILINWDESIERAEIIREKGTNRNNFRLGKVDKYEWIDIGSSYLPGELSAAFLWAQLEQADVITSMRRRIWDAYKTTLEPLANSRNISLPTIPSDCEHNGHMFYVILNKSVSRKTFLNLMAKKGVNCVPHYVPLHSSPYGRRVAKVKSSMTVTDNVAEQLVRLPLWVGMENSEVLKVVESIYEILS